MTIYACDCDLRAAYVMASDGAQIFNGVPARVLAHWAAFLSADDTLLFEIASATDYTDRENNKGKAYNKRRWMIYNLATAGMVGSVFPRLLVAPSSTWTRGYNLTMRHTLAKADARNKDLRECQTMIFMHRLRPQDWCPLDEYLEVL